MHLCHCQFYFACNELRKNCYIPNCKINPLVKIKCHNTKFKITNKSFYNCSFVIILCKPRCYNVCFNSFMKNSCKCCI
eukprot:UN05575